MTELCKLAHKYGTDKVEHNYTYYYDKLFNDLRNEKINFLEIGIFKGASIKMWDEYFTKGNIFCIDNCIANSAGYLLCEEKTLSLLNKHSPKIFAKQGCQNDRKKLKELVKNIEFDIIVDDGLHFFEHQQTSLGVLFKNLKSGGVYIIEDIVNMWALQTGSWWGQKDGVEDTNAHREGGKSIWLEKYKTTGILKPESVFSDSTWSVLHNFLKTGSFDSIYTTINETSYLENNIESIEIISAPEQRSIEIHNLGIPKYEGTPNTKLKQGCIAIIKKK